MPMPTTRLTTTIDVSNTDRLGRNPSEVWSAVTQRLEQELRQRPVLSLVVVDLGRQPHDLAARAGPREEPGLDPALPDPGRQGGPGKTGDGRAGAGGRKRQRGDRADHFIRTGRSDPQHLADDRPASKSESVVPLHQLRPAARQESAENAQALRDR